MLGLIMKYMSVPEKVQAFFSSYPARMYKKGEVLIQAGDAPEAYFVTGGLIMQYDIAKNGSKLALNIYKPGAFISLSAILNDLPSAFFFEATEHTSVHVAPAADVAQFLQNNPDVVYDALARMSRGGDGLMLRLARAMEGSAEGRILQELMIMQNRFFKGSTTIDVTETDLAAKTGLARETVSRTFKKLSAEGIIRTERGKIEISDKHYM